MRGMWSKGALAVLMLISLAMIACGGKKPPVARPAPRRRRSLGPEARHPVRRRRQSR